MIIKTDKDTNVILSETDEVGLLNSEVDTTGVISIITDTVTTEIGIDYGGDNVNLSNVVTYGQSNINYGGTNI